MNIEVRELVDGWTGQTSSVLAAELMAAQIRQDNPEAEVQVWVQVDDEVRDLLTTLENVEEPTVKYVDGAFDKARSLLGEQVVVSLDDQVVVSGRLLTISDGGEVVLVDDMGSHHYCWPLLDIKSSAPENVEEPT